MTLCSHSDLRSHSARKQKPIHTTNSGKEKTSKWAESDLCFVWGHLLSLERISFLLMRMVTKGFKNRGLSVLLTNAAESGVEFITGRVLDCCICIWDCVVPCCNLQVTVRVQ